MADRMRRLWAPWDLGEFTITAGNDASIDTLGEVEFQLQRELRQWTLTRLILQLQLHTVAGGQSESMYGLRVENENVPLGTIDPMSDPEADWIYISGRMVEDAGFWGNAVIDIDNRSQRKSQGEQSRLLWYLHNAGPDTLYVSVHGRCLLLID